MTYTDEVTDTEATEADEATETSEASEATETKRTRATPTYALATVGDALPESDKTRRKPRKGGGGGRGKNLFIDLLTPVVEDAELHGHWLEIAKYETPTGARNAQKAIENGDRDLPAGDWEFETRRFNEEVVDEDGDLVYEEDENGDVVNDAEGQPLVALRRVSRLYARLVATA